MACLRIHRIQAAISIHGYRSNGARLGHRCISISECSVKMAKHIPSPDRLVLLRRSTTLFITFLLLFTRHVLSADDDTSGTCSETSPCVSGCCSSTGSCGFGDDYCGDTCISSCDATAECGQYAAVPGTTCPLNVCCSQYGYAQRYLVFAPPPRPFLFNEPMC